MTAVEVSAATRDSLSLLPEPLLSERSLRLAPPVLAWPERSFHLADLLDHRNQPGTVRLEELGEFRCVLVGRGAAAVLEDLDGVRVLHGLGHGLAQARHDRLRHPLGHEQAG